MIRQLITFSLALLLMAGTVIAVPRSVSAGDNRHNTTMRRLEHYFFLYCKKHTNRCEDIMSRLCDNLSAKKISLGFCAPPPPQQCTTQCNDGLDNDGDGLTDLNDQGCTDSADNNEYDVLTPPSPQCADGIDNDSDNLTDLDDPGCTGMDDDDEFNEPAPVAQCADGVDNDSDGLTDLADPGCEDFSDDNEYHAPPPTGLNHLIITEVYYDTDATHGSEPANEWVEIFNGTGASIDLTGWRLRDASGQFDLVPTSTTIAHNGYLVLTASSTTASFWPGSGATFINLDGQIGNGLGNTGDALYLVNSSDVAVDSLSWGTDVSVFNPAAPDPIAGHSLSRANVTTDTDTSADWVDLTTPTPGS